MKNPFRYRSYYFDQETGLYYLNSRYYDPEIGRFINIDDISVLSETQNTFNGLNLFAYCHNNPISNLDANGMSTYKNNIHRIQYSELVWNLFGLNNIWFNIYQKQIFNIQTGSPDVFYSFTEIENNKTARIGVVLILKIGLERKLMSI